MSYADECYERILGFPPTRPASERTPEERRASLEKFFEIMKDMPEDELSDTFMRERPLNISILEDEQQHEQSEPAA